MSEPNASRTAEEQRALDFLRGFRAPLRVTVNEPDGHPTICSLWFVLEGRELVCATHRGAHVARRLREDPRCGFELATNEPPYRGVRGHGRAQLGTEGAAQVLGQLIDRYLGRRDSRLARWLLGRIEQEVVIRIAIERLTAWDYTDRMTR